MPQFRLATQARDDIRQIWLTIARDNRTAADKLIDNFTSRFDLFALNPQLGESCPAFAVGDLRSFSIGNYVVYFRPTSDGVEIFRVIHGARNMMDGLP